MTLRRLSKRWKVVLFSIFTVAALGITGATVARGYMANNPAACGKCHIMQPYVNSYFGADFLDSVHAGDNQTVKCQDCHRRTVFRQAGELITYITGNYAVSDKGVDTQASCKRCHQIDLIVDRLKDRTEFQTDPQRSYHLNAEQAKACRDPQAELVRCQDCHKVHRSPVNYCATCHVSSFGIPEK